jgi:hypothetical protein
VSLWFVFAARGQKGLLVELFSLMREREWLVACHCENTRLARLTRWEGPAGLGLCDHDRESFGKRTGMCLARKCDKKDACRGAIVCVIFGGVVDYSQGSR